MTAHFKLVSIIKSKFTHKKNAWKTNDHFLMMKLLGCQRIISVFTYRLLISWNKTKILVQHSSKPQRPSFRTRIKVKIQLKALNTLDQAFEISYRQIPTASVDIILHAWLLWSFTTNHNECIAAAVGSHRNTLKIRKHLQLHSHPKARKNLQRNFYISNLILNLFSPTFTKPC